MNNLEEKIHNKSARIGVIGLGYVGLTILQALALAGYRPVGYDRNQPKVEGLLRGVNHVQGIDINPLLGLIQGQQCFVSFDANDLQGCDVFIITVPTSLDSHKAPDLSKVKNAAHIVAKHMKKGALIINQSTSFPFTTEQVILPILRESHLKEKLDFHLSFIPEISDFGNQHFDFKKIPKIIGGLTTECAKLSALLYSYLVEHVSIVSSMDVAEGAKILQNAYRLVNISLINEMKMMFDTMGMDIWSVIDAAASKPFGFIPFYPGPGIGGDCIPVDPCYMIWKAKETLGPTSMLNCAIQVNEETSLYVKRKILSTLLHVHTGGKEATVLLLGVAFKKDVSDVRESAAVKILAALENEGVAVDYHDPFVERLHPSSYYPNMHKSSVQWTSIDIGSYDCIVILTDHTFYNWQEIGSKAKKIVDTRGVIDVNKYHHKLVRA